MTATSIVAERFAIGPALSRGGMGSIHRGVDLSTGGAVAVKLVHLGRADALARARREATLLARVASPFVARHLAHGLHGEEFFVAMEWIDGEDLSSRLRRGPMKETEARRMGASLLRGLAHLHEHSIVHRDVKPANAMLLSDGSVKLVDLGIARDANGDATLITVDDAVFGTPAYMSPEQAVGETVDARTDLWALGVVLFEAITARQPFEGDNPIAVLGRVLVGAIPTLPQSLASAGYRRIVQGLLVREPKVRWSAVDEILASLETSSPIDLDDGVVKLIPRITAFALADAHGPPASCSALAPHGAKQLLLGGSKTLFDFGEMLPSSAQVPAAFELASAWLELAPDARFALALARPEHGADPLGQAIDRLADLLHAASSGSVALDEEIRVLLEKERESLSARARALLARLFHDKPSIPPYEERMLGRDGELAAIEALCNQARQEETGAAIVIVGEPGLGKSTLMKSIELRLASRDEPWQVVRARGSSLKPDAPLLAVSAIFEAMRRPQEAADAPPAGEWGFQESWLARLAAVRSRPVVAFIDDAHWIDVDSLKLFGLATRQQESTFVSLFACRPEGRTRLERALVGAHMQFIQLAPLSRRAGAKLIERIVAPDQVVSMVERAGGNPFFLRQLARAAQQGSSGGTPLSIQAVLEERFHRLSANAAELAHVLACFGDSAPVEALEVVTNLDVASATDELTGAGILAAGEVEPGRRSFAHALWRETAESSQAIPGLHLRIATWLAERRASPETIARHLARAGDAIRSVEILVSAARLSEQAGDDIRRLQLATEAVRYATAGVTPGLGLAAIEALASALEALPRAAAAEERILELLQAMESSAADAALVARVRTAACRALTRVRAYARAEEVLGALEGSPGAEPIESLFLMRCWLCAFQAKYHELLATCERMTEAGIRVPAPIQALRAVAAAHAGARELAHDLLRETPALEGVDHDAAITVLNGHGLVAYLEGDYERAATHWGRALERANAAGSLDRAAGMLHNLGDAALHDGNLGEARRLFGESLAISIRHGFDHMRLTNEAYLAHVDVVSGQAMRLQDLLACHAALAERSDGLPYTLVGSLAVADLEAAGLLGQAIALARRLVEAARSLGHSISVGRLEATIARLEARLCGSAADG